MNPTDHSGIAFREAINLMPGGVNSPVRAFRGISGNPVFISRARGSSLFDLDGNEYTDYCLSWGVCIHGHANPVILKAVHHAADQGSSFGAPTLYENNLAKLVISMVPSIEKLRLVSSGTEAVMSAVRLARGYTRKPVIVKFDGCYHGHSDSMLVSAGSGLAGFFDSNSDGVPEETLRNTISIPFNNTKILEKLLLKRGNDIAAVIVEPIPANMGLILPEPGFLIFLRQITRQYDILLIFDEVITGFRMAAGGAQQFTGVIPDITILGKIIGGGFPMAAFGGSAVVMDHLSPVGNVYQAGTLSGNPVAAAAGIAVLELLNRSGFYDDLAQKTNLFQKGLQHLQDKFPVMFNCLPGMFSIFFGKTLPKNFQDVKKTEQSKFPRFYRGLLQEGVYFSPGYYETCFISLSHSETDLEKTLKALNHSLESIFSN